jgi:hypothetical protein
MNIS